MKTKVKFGLGMKQMPRIETFNSKREMEKERNKRRVIRKYF